MGWGMAGHAECVKYVKSFNLPMLVTGGGVHEAERGEVLDL